MKKIILITFVGIIAFLLSCDDSSNKSNDSSNDPVSEEQAKLNESLNPVAIGLTGDSFGTDATIAHNGAPLTTDETIRDVYTNLSEGESIRVGTIFTKHTFLKGEQGRKSDLVVTFAMIKREAGYYPDGGDWEYVKMPNDGTNNYLQNPNGKLPTTEDNINRGKIVACASCHQHPLAGSDFVFTY